MEVRERFGGMTHAFQNDDPSTVDVFPLQFDRPIRRPSGLVLDHDDDDGTPIIYVLSLWDKAVHKFRLTVLP